MNRRVRVAGIFFQDNRLLLVQHRKGSDYWVLPGGRLEANETTERCLVRELMEECCVEVRVTGLAGMGSFQRDDRVDVDIFLMGEIVSGTPALGTDPEAGSTPILSAVEQMSQSEFRDAVFYPDTIKKILFDNWGRMDQLKGAFLTDYYDKEDE